MVKVPRILDRLGGLGGAVAVTVGVAMVIDTCYQAWQPEFDPKELI